MAFISARSPFFVSNEGFDEGALLTIDIGQEQYTPPSTVGLVIEKSYTLNFRKQTELDIAPLIRSEIRFHENSGVTEALQTDVSKRIRLTVSGSINDVAQSDVVTFHTASNGYFYYEDGYNKDFTDEIKEDAFYAGSNDVIYRLDDEPFYIPLFNPSESEYTAEVYFYLKGELLSSVNSGTLGYDEGLTGIIELNRYKKIWYGNDTYYTYSQRVEGDGGSVESSNCLVNFYDKYKVLDVDRVIIIAEDTSTSPSEPTYTKVLDIKTIEECRYKPYRLEFKNKHGVEESLWFFKRSDKTLEIRKEEYRRNIFSEYSSGSLDKHQYHNFNVDGRESLSLNSGWLPESFYENFKQLMLSEEVWIHYKDNKLPINLKTTELQEKKHVNEKLINYSVEVEFAFDTIGNVV